MSELATKENPLAVVNDYGDMQGKGLENLTPDEVALPFLNILQALSPEVTKGHKSYVESAVAGRFFNNVTKETYPENGLIFQPVSVRHEWVEWKPRDQGGGRVGTHARDSDVITKAQSQSQQFGKYKTDNGNDLVETIYLLGFIHRSADLDEQLALGPGEPVIISFSSTKIKPFKQIMYRISTFQGRPPLFAHRLKLDTFLDQNKKGQNYFNFKITAAVADDIGKSLIPAKLDEAPHPMLVAGRDLNKAFNTGTVVVSDKEPAVSEAADSDVPF